MLKRKKHFHIGRLHIGWGVWDSWGLGVSYCHYTRGVVIEFIRWYVYTEFWPKQA